MFSKSFCELAVGAFYESRIDTIVHCAGEAFYNEKVSSIGNVVFSIPGAAGLFMPELGPHCITL